MIIRAPEGLDIRDIPGAPGYGASADGRIWSHWKWGVTENGTYWREISQQKKKNSEYRVTQIGPSGAQKRCQVHRLVAAAFFGAIPIGLVVNHKDCDKSNNLIINLEIVTPEENERHALEHGRKLHGEDHGNAIYTEQQIRELKKDYSNRNTTKLQLAIEHGINRQTVYAVLSGRQWSHV